MSAESLDKINKGKKRSPLAVWVVILVVLFAAVFIVVKMYELEKPQVSLGSDISLLGGESEIEISFLDEKSGIQSISLSLQQGNNKVLLVEKSYSRHSFFSGGEKKIDELIKVDSQSLGAKDGRADLLVTVHDYSFWKWMEGNVTRVSYPVVFDTKPPRLRMVESPVAIKPGSAGVIVYRANEELFNHGVTIDQVFHPGFPVSGRNDDMYAALIAIPYDAESVRNASIQGVDRAGNNGRIAFGLNVRKVKKHSDRINVTDGFLNKKVPEFAQYYPGLEGEFIDQYLKINNDIRAENGNSIKEICSKTNSERLWKDSFKRMRRSSRRASFADYRSYYFNGRKIDNQVHLGIDLASVKQAPVEAANDGIVAFADYLGIYGNMVVIDHGQGLFSLYSHLSKITVEVNDHVGKGAVLGNTGTSGMAGGDHLHFSVLVNGVFVNPVEWWDKHWVELNINSLLK